MGWGSGSELAADVWKAVRFLIPAGERRMIAARKLIYEFEQRDCDTIDEAEELCADAGRVYDEAKDESVYTPLSACVCNHLCEIGVPCCECPHAPEKFLYMTSAVRDIPEREQYLALARAALTPNFRAECMAKADNAKTDVCRDCQFGSRGLCDLCEHGKRPGPAVPATFAREPGPASVNLAARQREHERNLDAAVAECKDCRLVDCRDCGTKPDTKPAAHYHGIPLPPNVTAQNMEDVGNVIASEVLRRAFAMHPEPKPESDIPDHCKDCQMGSVACHICEFGAP